MIVSVDHVSIAVSNMQRSIERFANHFNIEFGGNEDVPEAGTSTAFFPIGNTSIELIHPMNDDSPVRKFLDKKGGGLHHICFRTDDLVGDMERLKALGYEFITETPVKGAHNSLVVFIHPKCCDGVLIELKEAPTTTKPKS